MNLNFRILDVPSYEKESFFTMVTSETPMPKTNLDGSKNSTMQHFAPPYNIDSVYNYKLSKTYRFFNRFEATLFLLKDKCPHTPDIIIELNLKIVKIISSFFLQKKIAKRFDEIYNLYSNKLAIVREKKKGRKPIIVYFIVLYESSFAPKPLFEKMLADSDFIPKILVTPDVLRGHNGYESSYKSLKEKYG